MWSRRFVWRCCLWVVLSPGLAQADGLLRGTVESLRDAQSAVLRPVAVPQPNGSTHRATGDPVALWSGAVLAEFYWSRDYEPAWTRQAALDALLGAIESSPADGLDPADFHARTVRRLSEPGVLDALGQADRLAADLQLSDALLRYIHHIRFGRLDPAQLNRGWNHRPPVDAGTLVSAMAAVLESADPSARLAELAPNPFFYANLKRALADYGGAARLGGLSPIPVGRTLSQGARDPRVREIRARLELLGDHRDPPPADPERFDDALRASLIAFQGRVGLAADGVAGPATVAALNRPYDAGKVEQIRMNLERMRWFYDGLPPDYVLVDVAGFMVHVVRDGRVDWSTRVVVGTPKDQTPSFRDEIEHLVFNPTWTVPPSIQKKMRGAGRYKMVDRRTGRAVRGGNASDYRRYSLIQAAGPGNALGRVKFMFPNGHSVYLHDTPSKGLFSHGSRAYSHGCVRVQNPLKLAEVILDRPNWDQSEIDRVVATNRTRYVNLDDHLPVILYYLTAMADEHGKTSFRRDIYGRDQAVLQAFRGEPSKARIRFAPLPASVPVPAQTPDASPAAPLAAKAGVGTRATAPTAAPPAPDPERAVPTPAESADPIPELPVHQPAAPPIEASARTPLPLNRSADPDRGAPQAPLATTVPGQPSPGAPQAPKGPVRGDSASRL